MNENQGGRSVLFLLCANEIGICALCPGTSATLAAALLCLWHIWDQNAYLNNPLPVGAAGKQGADAGNTKKSSTSSKSLLPAGGYVESLRSRVEVMFHFHWTGLDKGAANGQGPRRPLGCKC